MSLLIPISSAVLTFLASQKEVAIGYIGQIGLGLTILTIINAVFRPNERYVTATHKLVELHDWEMKFVIGLRKEHSLQFKNLNGLLVTMDKDLSELGLDMADQLFPREIGQPKSRQNRGGEGALG